LLDCRLAGGRPCAKLRAQGVSAGFPRVEIFRKHPLGHTGGLGAAQEEEGLPCGCWLLKMNACSPI
ncbi:MAG: hypothetical protein ACRDRP_12860, partial [Pseudonocardiaceae bacterium]